VNLGCRALGQALAAEIQPFYMNLRNPSLKKLRIVNRYYFSA
jgi:hypothetical protein